MRCRPGDIAYIVKSAAGNEGRVVEVINADTFELPGDLGLAGEGHLWRCRSRTGLATNVGIPIGLSEDFAFPDAWLLPIRPDGITDEEVRDLYQPEGITA